MIALSVRQPWAERIASGAKRDEWRTWPTKHRGPLLVVSSKSVSEGDERAAAGLPLGVAVCVVEIVGCDWVASEDAYAWRIGAVQRVEPFPVRGNAALYHVDDRRIVLAGERIEHPKRRTRAASTSSTSSKSKPRATPGRYAMSLDGLGDPFHYFDTREERLREARRMLRKRENRGSYVQFYIDGLPAGQLLTPNGDPAAGT